MDLYTQGLVDLLVSEILFCEVGNALRYKPDYDTDKLKSALLQLFNLNMKIVHLTETLITRVSDIAYDSQITLHDALPVAVAEHRKAVCVTADEETQYRKLRIKGTQ